MNFISKIKKNILYLFIALPLLLIGYESFMAVALGSRTWSFLLIGQIAVVPLIAYFFYYIYNVIGGQNNGISLLYFFLSFVPIAVFGYILTNTTALGAPLISSSGAGGGGSAYQAPTLDQVLAGFTIFGFIAVPVIIVLLVLLFVFPDMFVGLFGTIKNKTVPTIMNVIKFPIDSFFSIFNNNDPIIGDDVCNVYPGGFNTTSKVPSFYLAHIAFFAGYLLTNAINIYRKPKEGGVDEKAYNSRRYRTLMTIISISLLYLILAYVRSTTTGCESPLGTLFSSTMFSSLGFLWYLFAQYCGCRASDLTGISSSLVTQSAKSPIVCLNPNAPVT